ncbi:AraC family transcriptional regulator [Piscinibacter sp.]|jgi:transcriptional regulator GlxA family with amidase domain|uniref:AraC family transcriptional regulator n=1 Tax=Piscinibacter sp. TaxID=1903157 RepID=UPI002F3F979A
MPPLVPATKHPAGASRSALSIARALDHIHGHLGERLPLEDLAAIARLSVFRFATVFRQRVGESPHRYICRLRVERAQALLRDGMPAAIVATETGFYDQSHLSRHFKSVCGMTPGRYLSQTRAAPEPRLERAA